MGSFNLKHSNLYIYFPHKLCSTLSVWQGELEQSAVFTCRIYIFFFCLFSISTLYTRRRRLKKKKKERLVQIQCTTTSQGMDTDSAMLYSICTTHPWDFGCWVVYKSKNRRLYAVERFFFVNSFSTNPCVRPPPPPKTEKENLLRFKVTLLKIDLKYRSW